MNNNYLNFYSQSELEDKTPCHNCGTPTPYVLLDSKSTNPEDENSDFDILLCKICYGPNWLPV